MRGCSVRVVDNLTAVGTSLFEAAGLALSEKPHTTWKKNAIQLAVSGLDDTRVLNEWLVGADAVVHLAANTGVQASLASPLIDFESNALGTLNVLEAARKLNIKTFVFASSGAPMGNQEPPFSEMSLPKPASPYGASKLSGEAYCQAYSYSFGLNTFVLRFSNVYGPHSAHKESVVASFCKAVKAGMPIQLNGGGQQSRDFLYVEDLCEAVIACLESRLVGSQIFQISSGKETTIRSLAVLVEAVAAELGLPSPSVIDAPQLAVDVERNFANNERAKRRLNWEPETELRVGLTSTMRYFLDAK